MDAKWEGLHGYCLCKPYRQTPAVRAVYLVNHKLLLSLSHSQIANGNYKMWFCPFCVHSMVSILYIIILYIEKIIILLLFVSLLSNYTIILYFLLLIKRCNSCEVAATAYICALCKWAIPFAHPLPATYQWLGPMQTV